MSDTRQPLRNAEILRRTLEAILSNATSYHADERGKQRALGVIGSWARDALQGRLHSSVEKITSCDKTLEGDPVEVHPSDSRAESQAGLSGPSGSPTSPSKPVLLVVAIKTDQPNIERRLRTVLAAAEPIDTDMEPFAWAKATDELVAADLDALASLGGWDAVSRLRVGDVAAGGFSTPPAGAATGDGAGPLAADDPDTIGCPTCGGDGIDDDFYDCPQCDGTGQVPVEPEVPRGY